jgi:hypothetical protein
MVRRPAGRCRIDPIEPEVAEFQHIDRAKRIALADPRFPALALFGRRPSECVERPSSRQPKTYTPTDILPTQPPCRLTARRIRAVPDQAILQRFEIEDEFEFGWLLNR